MSNAEFIKRATAAVVDYFNRHVDVTDNFELTADDTFVVWSCKTLQNNKALISTTIPDGMYYEITYNGDKGEMYLDGLLGLAAMYINVPDFPAADPLTALAVGIVSGLAATGADQVIKQIGKDN